MTGQSALLPNGEQVFLDDNGVPLASGTVTFYVPTTTTPKNTWQDAGQSVLNTNPVTLDAAGRAIIYGSGTYRQIVKDSLGNVIWDQLTQGASPFATTNGSVASASTTDIGAVGSNFITITGTTTINSFGSSASTASPLYFVVFAGALTIVNSGAITIPGGQNLSTVANGFAVLEYLGSGNWIILSYHRPNGQTLSWSGGEVTLASSATVDLGLAASNLVAISGTTGVTSFGSSASTANPVYVIRFTGALILTYNASSMILPGAANITTVAGAALIAEYLGSGNWRGLFYSSFAGSGGGGSGSVAIIAATRSNSFLFASNTTLTASVSEVVAKTAVGGTAFLGSTLTSTLNFGSTGANGLDTGAIAASTFYGLYWIYNPGSNTWASLASLSFTAPTLPSGYTAFGLVGVVPTNASSQIVPGFALVDRTSYFQRINIFSTTAGVLSLTSQSVAAAVPTIAKTVMGLLGSIDPPNGSTMVVASSSGGTGMQFVSTANDTTVIVVQGYTNAGAFIGLPLITAQTIYWQSATTNRARMDITGFTI